METIQECTSSVETCALTTGFLTTARQDDEQRSVVRPGAGAERSPRGVRLPAGRHLVQQRRGLRLLLQVRHTPALYRKSDFCIPRNETARPRSQFLQ